MTLVILMFILFFFFQAEDGIRDYKVTGVQTCALPICERARWWEGELRAGAGAALTPVTPRPPPPTVAADGDPLDVTGRTLIAPLVGRLLEGIRTGTTPSPSLADGMRAQAVLDATLEAAARGAWVEVAR